MKRYPPLAMALHWLSASVMLWALLSGFALAARALPPALASTTASLNVALAALLIPFWLLRLGYRLCFRMPPPEGMAERDWRKAKLGHRALYALASLSLLSGVLMMERPIAVFGWFVLNAPLAAGVWTRGFAAIHFAVNLLLALAVVAHIAAVALHHRRGLPILQRMSPVRAPAAAVPPLRQK
ncbi:cytochrome B [Chromobacterium phragmitis]|uniref:cytochrome b n=1 Tax=Chromobacterium phragmitis TaxID=2202141 RepID=UPI000DECF04C|nr:cytochrome b/b6 domain-containing protein [Chromobacterium phragmitis]AXE28703.1 cytochrome B [Chromobacterium phragmitis]